MATMIFCEECDHYNKHECIEHKRWVTDSTPPPLYKNEPYWIVFDVETAKLMDDIGGRKIVEEQKKWSELGLTALGIWDSKMDRPYLYDMESLAEGVAHLESSEFAVSFNGNHFDLPVLNSLAGRWINLKESYDLHKEIKRTGCPWKGSGLGPTAERTIGRGKTGTGAHAPVLAKEGKWARLFTYNMDDLYLTRDLMNHVRLHGWVVGPDGNKHKVQVPEWFKL